MLTREEKIAKAERLHGEGLSNPEIGARLGVSTDAIWQWLNPAKAREHARLSNAQPERKRAKRAHENTCRGLCSECGAEMGAGSSYPSRSVKRCAACQRELLRAQRIARWKEIQRLYVAGETYRQRPKKGT